MSDVWVRVFETKDDAAAFGVQMTENGYRIALSDAATVVKIRYSEHGAPQALNISGDGDNFVVTAFK